MILCIIYFSPLFIALYSIFSFRKAKKQITRSKVLVVGGSSGLGFSFLKILKKLGNHVVGTSRDPQYISDKNEEGVYQFIQLDVCDESTFEQGDTNYDYIFYCTGISLPGGFDIRTVDDHMLCTNTNYMGMIKVLKHYTKINKKPFHFTMIGSTLALFELPGYSTYTPTKSAIVSFFYSTYNEFLKKNIRLHLFNPTNMQTKGFERENQIKDAYNVQIENLFNTMSPEDCAEYFLDNMFYRKVVVTDYFTYLCQIRHDCEKPIDYFLFPLAVIIVFLSKVFTTLIYKLYY